jgi:hypothetical protein
MILNYAINFASKMAISINCYNSSSSILRITRSNKLGAKTRKSRKISWLEIISKEECTVIQAGAKPLVALELMCVTYGAGNELDRKILYLILGSFENMHNYPTIVIPGLK